MKILDRFIQKWRMRHALGALPSKVRLIDVGAHEGELFLSLKDRLVEGFGIEPLRAGKLVSGNFVIASGFFPATSPDTLEWDAITMLAVLEHIPESQHQELAISCHRFLKTGGVVVITVPSPVVDHILNVLGKLRLIHGMSLEEHFGFMPRDTTRIFSEPLFRLVTHRKFQLGLNNLYVFEKR